MRSSWRLYLPSFMLIGRNPKEEFEKEGFRVFAILWKNYLDGNGRGLCHVIQGYSQNLRICGFWMCDIRCGSYRPKSVDLAYSAPYMQTYVIFCVCVPCRGLDQPSKLHLPPMHGLACSTRFTYGRIKIENNNNKNFNDYNRVPSTAGAVNRVCLHTRFPAPAGLAP